MCAKLRLWQKSTTYHFQAAFVQPFLKPNARKLRAFGRFLLTI
nr:MAG TPA: hypothetical protein [Caudoviricetes sp.]DAX37383.1 MAG TPA: hypothetical protein [Caudoviricetes sp.]